MRPANRPIAVVRGDTYQHLVSFTLGDGTPEDLTGNTYAAQLRASPDAAAVLAAMDVDLTGLDVGAVWLTIDATVTAGLHPGRRAWDLQETNPTGHVVTIMGGPADVVPDVTRPIP